MDCKLLVLLGLGFIWALVQTVWFLRVIKVERQLIRVKRDMAVLRGEFARRGVIDD